MKKKTITFVTTLCLVLVFIALFNLVNLWEADAKRGYAGVVFVVGVVLGVAIEYIAFKIDARIPE